MRVIFGAVDESDEQAMKKILLARNLISLHQK